MACSVRNKKTIYIRKTLDIILKHTLNKYYNNYMLVIIIS